MNKAHRNIKAFRNQAKIHLPMEPSYLQHVGLAEFYHAVLSANGRSFWFDPSPVLFASEQAFWMQAATVTVSRGASFWMSICAVVSAFSHSPFLHCVRNISCLSVLEKMGRITAGTPIAAVANELRCPLARCEEKGKAMRQNRPLPNCKIVVVVIAALKKAPAFALRALAGTFVNLFPEAGDVLFSKNGRASINSSHSMNLRDRFELWLGSFGCFRTLASRLYFNTNSIERAAKGNALRLAFEAAKF